MRTFSETRSNAGAVGLTVSLVARRHGVAVNQLWRRLVAQGGLTATGSGEEVVPALGLPGVAKSGSRAIGCSARKRWEAEILKRQALVEDLRSSNHKRIWRVMKTCRPGGDVKTVVLPWISGIRQPGPSHRHHSPKVIWGIVVRKMNWPPLANGGQHFGNLGWLV